MKILALTADSYAAPGGIAQYNRDMFAALLHTDLVEKIYLQPRNRQPGNIPIDQISQVESPKSKYGYALNALITAFTKQPDLLFCAHINLLLPAWLVAHILGIPLWLQIHGIEAWQKKGLLTRKIIETTDLVTSVSRYTRRRFLAWSKISHFKVKVLPNTVSNEFKPADKEVVKEKLNLSNRKVILTVGRVSLSEMYKGHDKILECIPSLIKKVPEILYLVIGEGDGLRYLNESVKEKNLEPYVRFIGNLPNNEVRDYYQASDLFAMPSTGEGFGIVFLEAMASGATSLGLDSDGSVDPLQDGNLGVVTSQAGLCDALLFALKHGPDPDIAVKVQDIFGHENYREHVTALLENLQGKSAGCVA